MKFENDLKETNKYKEIDKECVHSPFYRWYIQKECGVRILLLLDARYSKYFYLFILAHQLCNKFKINLTFMNRRRYAYYYICYARSLLSSCCAHIKYNRKQLYFLCNKCVTYMLLEIDISKAVTGNHLIPLLMEGDK